MLIVTGSILAKPETLEQLQRLSIAHSRRSRGERGCEHHAVHADAENPLRLVFLERWTDRDALLAHFGEPNARAFAGTARRLAAEPPIINVYSGQEIDPATLSPE